MTPHDDDVAGQDAGVAHALAAHTQAEQLLVRADAVGLHREIAFEVLDRQPEGAGRDAPEQGDQPRRRDPVFAGDKHRRVGEPIAPRPTRLLVEATFGHQRLEMRARGLHGAKTERLLDLPHGRRLAGQEPLAHELEHLLARPSGRCSTHHITLARSGNPVNDL
jgi:hypothetical protein